MLRVLPIVLAVALCFSNLVIIMLDENSADKNKSVDYHAPRNHLTQNKNAQAAAINEVRNFEDVENPIQENGAIAQREENILRLYWDIVPNAVKYEILIEGATLLSYTNGIEIIVNDVGAKFQVNALSLDGILLENRIPIREIDTNPTSLRTTTELPADLSRVFLDTDERRGSL